MKLLLGPSGVARIPHWGPGVSLPSLSLLSPSVPLFPPLLFRSPFPSSSLFLPPLRSRPP